MGPLIDTVLYYHLCSTCLHDWWSVIQGRPRVWSLVVLLADIALVTRRPARVAYSLLALLTLWLLIERAEALAQFGLVDWGDWGAEQPVPPSCDCTRPPCQLDVGAAIPTFVGWLFVLYADFYLTRGFADGMRQQFEVVQSSVRVSERVTQMLAAYDTDEARRVVAEEGGTLPGALCASYERLLNNLDSYRVFLPDSLLYPERGTADASVLSPASVHPPVRSPPGEGEGEGVAEVAVCFTDIQSSTELWEASPQGMYDGLNLHNDVMRLAYAAHNGYEVKTIGDSFMVAFDTAVDALGFGLDAQLGLLRQQWPEELLAHRLCKRIVGPAGAAVWGGLRVRVGVQSGPTRVERNPVTKRADYFGHTVNTAARLESVLRFGGLIATSASVVEALSPHMLEALGSPVVHSTGPRQLKGVKDKFDVFALVPQSLAARLDSFRDEENPSLGVPLGSAGWPVEANSRSFSRSARRSAGALSLSQESSACTSSGGGALSSPPTLPQRSPQSPQQRRTSRSRIDLRLHQCSATCAAARVSLRNIEPVAERHPHFVAAAALAADRTQGVVDAVVSACVFVSWNTSRRCADHAASCRGFIGSSFRAPCHLGAASGGLLRGSLAAGRRSFATIVGGSVDFAAALAEEAERCGDTALAAGAVADDCVAAGIAFCAQLWESPGRTVVVHAVCPAEGDSKWLLQEAGGAARTSDALFVGTPAALFRRACAVAPDSTEAAELLEDMERAERQARHRDQESPVTDAIARLADRFRRGAVRTRLMPTQWDAGGSARSSPSHCEALS
eukprot:TRINITY_DN8580_c0_g1_i1.p1 TRINITY_DN8580_c0_g1~~TRINITY_DN8580_c0_g1_i1.p1  ORF type:complete len:898 (+),score=158.80 TRINITY_DN8580_c0_g1_i1:328-2694(+)